MKVRRLISLLALGTALSTGIGCAIGSTGSDSTQSGSTASTTEGLHVVTADVTQGKLVAQYVKSGRAITFELRLGPKMELPPDATTPEAPTMEVDARILDAEGKTFFMQIAGDKAMDSSWKSPQGDGIDEHARAADFAAAAEAEGAFRALTLPTELAELRLAGMDIAKSVARATDTSGKTAAFPGAAGATTPTAPADPATATTKGVVYWSPTSSVTIWDYQIYKKAVVASFIAEHSAVRLRGWSSSYSLLVYQDACNHGTCAGGSAMTSHCNYSGWLNDDGTHSRYFFRESSSSQDTVTDGCLTTYGAFFDNGSHVCNDDSLIQRQAITYDAYQDQWGGTCGDDNKRWYAPGCQ